MTAAFTFPGQGSQAVGMLSALSDQHSLVRATFDEWRVDGCPHHGPALVAADEVRVLHLVVLGELLAQREGRALVVDHEPPHRAEHLARGVLKLALEEGDARVPGRVRHGNLGRGRLALNNPAVGLADTRHAIERGAVLASRPAQRCSVSLSPSFLP